MTTKVKVTKRDAEKVLALVRKQFAGWLEHGADGPTLVKDWDWPGAPTPWAIIWEGGPYDWAMLAPYGGIEEEYGLRIADLSTEMPEGISLEPYSGWATCIYPA